MENTPTSTGNIRYLNGSLGQYVIDTSDDVLNIDTSSGAITLILPSIVGSGLNQNPKRFYVNDIGNFAGTNNITLQTVSGNVINSSTNYLLRTNGTSAEILIVSQIEYLANSDQAVGAGTITGGGTAPYFPIFVSATGIGNSVFSQNTVAGVDNFVVPLSGRISGNSTFKSQIDMNAFGADGNLVITSDGGGLTQGYAAVLPTGASFGFNYIASSPDVWGLAVTASLLTIIHPTSVLIKSISGAGTGTVSIQADGIVYVNDSGPGLLSVGSQTLLRGGLQYTGSTPTNGHVLTTDGSGNATWQAPTGGGVSGSGTTGAIPVWSSPTGLGDSYLSQSGNNVVIPLGKYFSGPSGTKSQIDMSYAATDGNLFITSDAGAFNQGIVYASPATAGVLFNFTGTAPSADGFEVNASSANIGHHDVINIEARGTGGGSGIININALSGSKTVNINYGLPSSFFHIGSPTEMIGALKYTGSTPANGNVLTADASGNATWNAPVVDATYTQTTAVTVGNTVAETSILTSTYTVPSNFFTAGRNLSLRFYGYHSAALAPTIRIRVKLGSVVVLDTGAVVSATSTNAYFEIKGEITCITTGVSGTVYGQGYYSEAGGLANGSPMVNTVAATVDTTVNEVLDITVEWGAASPSNTITCTNGYLMFER